MSDLFSVYQQLLEHFERPQSCARERAHRCGLKLVSCLGNSRAIFATESTRPAAGKCAELGKQSRD